MVIIDKPVEIDQEASENAANIYINPCEKTNLKLTPLDDSDNNRNQPSTSSSQTYHKLDGFENETDKNQLTPSPPSRPPRPASLKGRSNASTANSHRPFVPLPQAPNSNCSEELYELVDDEHKSINQTTGQCNQPVKKLKPPGKKLNMINRFGASFRVITDKKVNSLVNQFSNHLTTPGYSPVKVPNKERTLITEKCDSNQDYKVDGAFINYTNKFCDKLDEKESIQSLTGRCDYLQQNSSRLQSKGSFKDSCSLFGSTSHLSIKSQSNKKFKQIKYNIIDLFEKKELPKIAKYTCALHINPEETVKCVVQAAKNVYKTTSSTFTSFNIQQRLVTRIEHTHS
uniref:Uncharacterized protein n=1 Tax=Trichobilharzia regenti TaxID=157069 RepID=A0AA85J1R9_TRIRE|nr:unnamed protein product [Trichobilharzia regenti]